MCLRVIYIIAIQRSKLWIHWKVKHEKQNHFKKLEEILGKYLPVPDSEGLCKYISNELNSKGKRLILIFKITNSMSKPS